VTSSRRLNTATLLVALIGITTPARAAAQAGVVPPREPVLHTVRVPAPETQRAEIEARVPTEGRASIDLMMPMWSPGYYRAEDYASSVEALSARNAAGETLTVEHPAPNRWRVATKGAPLIVVTYKLACTGQTVTTNWVDRTFGVFNGAASFLTPVESGPRAHDIRLELPAAWPRAMTALEPSADGQANHFRAADFDTLVDSPIVAGTLDMQQFDVDSRPHYLITAGARSTWDAARAAADLQKMVAENRRFWGSLPYKQYLFLVVFRPGGGGLEHKDSTLITADAARVATPAGYARLLGLMTHEYVHAYNAKRLRPIELGPFDYETPPKTSSLWWAEGVTSYYAALALARAGLVSAEDFLFSISSAISQLQNAPGRLLQTLEQSSLDVWTNSLSGVNPDAKTVSYYVKGEVVGFLLDTRIRRATDESKSLDDVMKAMYKRYAAERGFTPEQLRTTASKTAGIPLDDWFAKTLASTEELDYTEVLAWYGLRLAQTPVAASGDQPTRVEWKLQATQEATAAQRRRLERLVSH
jgi:predicted metalloprotease with PDZ domain